jgi:hypothetical protein
LLAIGDAQAKVEPRVKAVAKPIPKAKSEPVQHGTKKDTTTSRSYWASKNLAYLTDQLSLHGVRIDPSQLRGYEEVHDVVKDKKVKHKIKKITKKELLKMIYEKLGI